MPQVSRQYLGLKAFFLSSWKYMGSQCVDPVYKANLILILQVVNYPFVPFVNLILHLQLVLKSMKKEKGTQ